MKYTSVILSTKLVEIEAENEFDALDQAKKLCKENEKVGQIFKCALTNEVELKAPKFELK